MGRVLSLPRSHSQVPVPGPRFPRPSLGPPPPRHPLGETPRPDPLPVPAAGSRYLRLFTRLPRPLRVAGSLQVLVPHPHSKVLCPRPPIAAALPSPRGSQPPFSGVPPPIPRGRPPLGRDPSALLFPGPGRLPCAPGRRSAATSSDRRATAGGPGHVRPRRRRAARRAPTEEPRRQLSAQAAGAQSGFGPARRPVHHRAVHCPRRARLVAHPWRHLFPPRAGGLRCSGLRAPGPAER